METNPDQNYITLTDQSNNNLILPSDTKPLDYQNHSSHEILYKNEYVRKNHIDPSAGLVYSMGCSLVHLAMLIGTAFIK